MTAAFAAASCSRQEPPLAGAPQPEDARLPAARSETDASLAPDRADASADAPTAVPGDGGAGRDGSADAGALGQTRDRPSATSPEFEARARALWDAIVNDDPERAMPFFFPREAYEQVKDVRDPARDWRVRLVAAYARDIREYARELGAKRAHATFVSLDVPERAARWVEPGEEWNRLGYYRVFGSRLRYRDASGRSGELVVKSLISWRGEWFVVHLARVK
jgi:hypothetical protein